MFLKRFVESKFTLQKALFKLFLFRITFFIFFPIIILFHFSFFVIGSRNTKLSRLSMGNYDSNFRKQKTENQKPKIQLMILIPTLDQGPML